MLSVAADCPVYRDAAQAICRRHRSDARGCLFLILVFAALIYRYTRTLALCLTVLAVATVALRFLADQQRLPTLAFLSQGLRFIAMVVAMVARFSEVLRARSASSDLVMGAIC